MSGGLTSIFGGGRSRSQQQIVQQPTAFQSLPGFAQDAFRTSVERGTSLAGQPELFAPVDFTPQQLQAAGQIEQLAGAFEPGAFQERISLFQDPFTENVLEGTIRDIQRGTQGTLADIGTGASAAGGFGGTRQALLEAEALRNEQQQIADASASIRSQAFNTALNSALQSIGQQAGLSSDLFNLGGQFQAQQTAEQQAPIQAANYLASLARGVPVGGGQFSSLGSGLASQSTGLLGSPGFQNLGNLAGGIGGLAAFSDRRLKENIKKVRTENDIPIYIFNYKGDDTKFEGVMAQDIQELYPEAVSEESGFLKVDYAQLPVKMKRIT